jgi:hypothetical protein
MAALTIRHGDADDAPRLLTLFDDAVAWLASAWASSAPARSPSATGPARSSRGRSRSRQSPILGVAAEALAAYL